MPTIKNATSMRAGVNFVRTISSCAIAHSNPPAANAASISNNLLSISGMVFLLPFFDCLVFVLYLRDLVVNVGVVVGAVIYGWRVCHRFGGRNGDCPNFEAMTAKYFC